MGGKRWTILAAALACAAALAAPQNVGLPKGTTVQKLGAGAYLLRLPDGRTVELRNFHAKSRSVGECTVFDAGGRKLSAGGRCSLRGGMQPMPVPGAAGKAPPPNPVDYVKIDDEVTWLPATLGFDSVDVNLPGAATIKPQSPAVRQGINPQPEPPRTLQK